MKLIKPLRRKRQRTLNPEKVIRGFVRALGQLRPAKRRPAVEPARSKA